MLQFPSVLYLGHAVGIANKRSLYNVSIFDGDAPVYLSRYCVPLAATVGRVSRNRSAALGNLMPPR